MTTPSDVTSAIKTRTEWLYSEKEQAREALWLCVPIIGNIVIGVRALWEESALKKLRGQGGDEKRLNIVIQERTATKWNQLIFLVGFILGFIGFGLLSATHINTLVGEGLMLAGAAPVLGSALYIQYLIRKEAKHALIRADKGETRASSDCCSIQ